MLNTEFKLYAVVLNIIQPDGFECLSRTINVVAKSAPDAIKRVKPRNNKDGTEYVFEATMISRIHKL